MLFKISAIIILLLILIIFKCFLGLALLTAIEIVIVKKISNLIYKKILKEKISYRFINVVSFLSMMFAIILCIFNIIPNIVELIIGFKDIDIDGLLKNLNSKNIIINKQEVISFVKYLGMSSLKFFNFFQKIGVEIIVSFVLTFFYILKENEIIEFLNKFEKCRCNKFYNLYKNIARKFMDSFIKILEAQILIAFINAICSTICLFFLNFDNVVVLGVMIFILSLIPVVGTIISLIPLTVMGYKIGGAIKVIYILIMIAVLHFLESYVLNPKIMSKAMKVPEFFTFLILLVSEHFLGTWGLIIGLPLFMFFLGLLEINSNE